MQPHVSDREGKYRINTAAAETGVPAATLRAWERRYGLPDPGRTDSAYRLYSDHDLAMIRRVRELCDGGMAPSEAAKVVLEEAQSWDTDVAEAELDPYDRLRDAIVRGVTDFDPTQTDRAVRHAMAMGPAAVVMDRIILPSMRVIGDLWYAGKIGIAQEHMATQIVGDAVTTMLALIERPEADRTVLLACFADEEHTFPSNGVAVHIASWGHRVVRLGPRTPPPAVGHAVEHIKPNLVGLSVMVAPPPHRARELVEGYAAACGDTPWVVGGSASGDLAELVESSGGHVMREYETQRLRSTLEGLMARRGRKR